MSDPLKPGDRVAFTAAFLKSTGQQAGETGHLRGTVAEVGPHIAVVRWDGEEMTGKAHVANLCLVGSRAFSAN